jgi:ribose transport system permease protein
MMSTEVAAPAASALSLRERLAGVEQAIFVLGITVVLGVVGALSTSGFVDAGNFATLLRLSSAFGILALAQAVVILGKGLDLSLVGVALGCGQATVAMMASGVAEWHAIGLMVLLALAIGLINGLLIAYAEIPALFVTLATGMLAIGVINILVMDQNYYALGPDTMLGGFARGEIVGLPRPIVIAALVFASVSLALRFTSLGRLIRAMGDNFETARSTGVPVRPLQVLTYLTSALLALVAGYVTVSIQGSVQTATSSFHPLLFTALTVAVIGGISLSGGRGSVAGVLAGTVFVAVLNNLLILRNLSAPAQEMTRGCVLIVAIFLDAWLHPRDEETAKTGEL